MAFKIIYQIHWFCKGLITNNVTFVCATISEETKSTQPTSREMKQTKTCRAQNNEHVGKAVSSGKLKWIQKTTRLFSLEAERQNSLITHECMNVNINRKRAIILPRCSKPPPLKLFAICNVVHALSKK